MRPYLALFKALLWKQTRECWMAAWVGIVFNLFALSLVLLTHFRIYSPSIELFTIIVQGNLLLFCYLLFGNTMAREAEKKTFAFLFTKPLQESHYLICSLAVSLLHCTILYSAAISLYAVILWLFIPSGNLHYVFPFIGSNL
ncbi:MAG: hypothetical protein RBU29_03920, partial [bacterium]|nr:hypothetical protein [bacterium]